MVVRNRWLAVAAVLGIGLAVASRARGQGLERYAVAGRAVASQFTWSVQAQVAAAGGGSGTIAFDTSGLTLPDGMTFHPWRAGVPVIIQDGSSTERVTIISADCVGPASSPCSATAKFQFAHAGRLRVSSGSDGLQEAVDFLASSGGGTVLLTPDWTGTLKTIQGVSGSTSVQIQDVRAGSESWYSWTGSRYAAAAGIGASGGGVDSRELEQKLYADQFPGADIGAKVNAAIAALPGGCGTVVIPVGTYNYATTIVKPRCVILAGQGSGRGGGGYGGSTGGTVLNWTVTTGVGVAVGDGLGSLEYPRGGIRDLTLNGPGVASASIGLWLGGDPAGTVLPSTDFADSQDIRGIRIAGFGTGIEWGNNAWIERVTDSSIFRCGTGVSAAPGYANSAENNLFVGDAIFNNAGAAVASSPDLRFVDTSFDFNGAPSTGAEYVDCHFEQQSGLFLSADGATIIGGAAMLDATSGTDTALFAAGGSTPGEWHISDLYVLSNHYVSEVLDWDLPPNSKLFISDLEGNGGQQIAAVTNAGYMLGSYVNAQLYGAWATPSLHGGVVESGAAILRDSGSSGDWNLELYDDASGSPTPYKFLRVSAGNFQIVNSAFNRTILSLSDSGSLSWGGGAAIASSQSTGSGSLVLSNSPQITGVPVLPASYKVGTETITQPATSGTLAVTSQLPVAGSTGGLGGAPLGAGQCTSATAAIPGAASGEAVIATPATYPGDGAYWEGWVSGPGAVEVKVCAVVAMTPATTTYAVRVLP